MKTSTKGVGKTHWKFVFFWFIQETFSLDRPPAPLNILNANFIFIEIQFF